MTIYTENTIKIGIPKNDRMRLETLNILKNNYQRTFDKQYKPNTQWTDNINSQSITSVYDEQADIALIMLREKDIPKAVNEGLIDIGFAGLNTIIESEKLVMPIEVFDKSACQVVVAVPNESRITTLDEITYSEDMVVYTSYPNTAKNFVAKDQAWRADIQFVSGSVEEFARMAADITNPNSNAIVEIVETGNSLKKNNYRVIETLFNSNLVLFGSSRLLSNAWDATGIELFEASLTDMPNPINRSDNKFNRINWMFYDDSYEACTKKTRLNFISDWRQIYKQVPFNDNANKFSGLAIR